MHEDFAILLFFFGISLTANVGLLIGWFGATRRARRFEDRLMRPAPEDDRRLDRIEQALDTLTAQADQLASGQEFLNRVIADRREPAPHVFPQREP